MGNAKKLISILVLAVFISGVSLLQDAFAEGKIAYVDLATVFDGYEKTKDYDVTLEQSQKDKQAEINIAIPGRQDIEQNFSLPNIADQEANVLAGIC